MTRFKFRHDQVSESGLELHLSNQQLRAYLGLPQCRVGWQGSGGDAGRSGSLVQGWAHSLR